MEAVHTPLVVLAEKENKASSLSGWRDPLCTGAASWVLTWVAPRHGGSSCELRGEATEIQKHGPEAQSKPSAERGSRTSLGSLVTRQGPELQHFWGDGLQNTIIERKPEGP